MYRPLVPCPSCDRHVLASETTCPFCSSALPSDLASRAMPSSPVRLNRAAAFVFGATVAVASCSGEVSDGSSSSSGGGGEGGTAQDAGMDAPDDDGGNVALYGDPPPPMDGGGGGVPLYGAPPPPTDAGTDAG